MRIAGVPKAGADEAPKVDEVGPPNAGVDAPPVPELAHDQKAMAWAPA